MPQIKSQLTWKVGSYEGNRSLIRRSWLRWFSDAGDASDASAPLVWPSPWTSQHVQHAPPNRQVFVNNLMMRVKWKTHMTSRFYDEVVRLVRRLSKKGGEFSSTAADHHYCGDCSQKLRRELLFFFGGCFPLQKTMFSFAKKQCFPLQKNNAFLCKKQWLGGKAVKEGVWAAQNGNEAIF